MLTRPPFTSEAAGLEAIDLAESVGLHLDPWQQLFVKVALAERGDGKYAAREVAELVSRQNGKGAGLEAIVLHGMFLVQDPLTLWTAHQFKTSTEAFLRVRGWIDGSDSLRSHVKRINAAHGEEGIELTSGVRLRFLARSKSSGRGFSPQRVIWDEAQELSKASFEAMNPSMRAQGNPQSIFAGTVPGDEVNAPEHWTRMRTRGRAGTSPRLAWLEWSPKGSDDPDAAKLINLDSRRVWSEASPGLGYRLTEETLADDRESMDDDSFAREALSIWPTLPELDMSAAFGQGMWPACYTSKSPGKVAAIGLAVDETRMWSSIGAASTDPTAHLGSNIRERGTDWLVGEALRIHEAHDCAVVVDSKGPASTLIDDLYDALGSALIVTTTEQYVTACADLFDLVQVGGVAHGDYTDLNEAIGAATKRKVGDRWAWARKSGDVSMLEAVTLALWGSSQSVEADPSAFFI